MLLVELVNDSERGAVYRRHSQTMRHIAVNWSVHTTCSNIYGFRHKFRVLCELGLADDAQALRVQGARQETLLALVHMTLTRTRCPLKTKKRIIGSWN